MLASMPAQTPVGAVMRRARLRKRMSQGELAEKLGVSRSRVNAWERDRAYPQNPVAVEEALDITLEPEPGPRPEPGPLDDLEPFDEWEQDVADDGVLSAKDKRELITWSRAERAEAVRRRRERAARRDEGLSSRDSQAV